MKTQKTGRKVKKVRSNIKNAIVAASETSWAIMTAFVAGLVTPPVHAKGAPLTG